MITNSDSTNYNNFSILNDAPNPIVIIKPILDDAHQIIDLKPAYINKAAEDILGITKTTFYNEPLNSLPLASSVLNEKKCYKVAYEGLKDQTNLYNSKIKKHFDINSWCPVEGYAAFSISDTSEVYQLEEETTRQYEKIKVLLQNSTDFIFDLDLQSNEVYIDFYSDKKGFIQKNFSITSDWLKEKKIHCEDISKVESITKKLNDDIATLSINIRLRRNISDEFNWYKIVFHKYQDYETKNNNVIGYGLNIHEEIVKLNDLKEQAETDLMTGVYNKITAKQKIINVLNNKENTSNAFFLIDLDDFKNINDSYGHPIGDKVIKLVAESIESAFRCSDIIFRLGGDEFGALAIGVKKIKYAKSLCETINKNIENNNNFRFPINVSIGVSINKNLKPTYEDYYNTADKALYQIKKQGKKGYEIKYF